MDVGDWAGFGALEVVSDGLVVETDVPALRVRQLWEVHLERHRGVPVPDEHSGGTKEQQ